MRVNSFYQNELDNMGRFINVDPVQDGSNWYVYCSNNPLTFVDPTGLSEERIFQITGESTTGGMADEHDQTVATYNQNVTRKDLFNVLSGLEQAIHQSTKDESFRTKTYDGSAVVVGAFSAPLFGVLGAAAAAGGITGLNWIVGDGAGGRLNSLQEKFGQLDAFYQMTAGYEDVSYSFEATLKKGRAFGADGFLGCIFPSEYSSIVEWTINASFGGNETSLVLQGNGEFDRFLNAMVHENIVEYEQIGSWAGLSPYGSLSYSNPHIYRKIPNNSN